MKIEDRHIVGISSDEACAFTSTGLELRRCVIGRLDLNALEFMGEVVVDGCVINELVVYCSWFAAGLKFRRNVVLSDVDYQMGGHNRGPIEISGNVFCGFFSFFDCQFDGHVTVTGNVFMQDTDLLAKENMGFDNVFDGGLTVGGNIGRLDVIR